MQIVTLDEFLQQSQTDIQDLSQTDDKNYNKNSDCYPSDLGRENCKELDQENFISDQISDSDFSKNTINRKILDFNQIRFL